MHLFNNFSVVLSRIRSFSLKRIFELIVLMQLCADFSSLFLTSVFLDCVTDFVHLSYLPFV